MSAGGPSFSPVGDGDRAGVLDALRGFALLGIFVSHMPDFSGYNFMPPDEQARLTGVHIDAPLAAAFEFLITNKFYSLFSLLFGVGFAVQLESAARRGANFARHFGRRLAVLLVIGLAHAGLWYGDILKDYALIGFLLIATARWSTGTVARAAAIVLAVRVLWPVLMAMVASGGAAATNDDPRGSFFALTQGFGGHDVAGVFSANLQLVRLKALQMIYDGKAVSVLGMFLLGGLIGRLRIYRDLAAHEGLLRRVLWLCAPVGVVGNLVVTYLHATTPEFPPTPRWVVEQALSAVAVPAMTLAYAAGFALLWLHGGRRVLERLAPVGRMALTSYVSQTLVGVALFYGIGLGLWGRVGLAEGTVLALGVFAAQCGLSALWLRRFRFGPLEWLWRRATYGAPIAFLRAADAAG